MTGSCPYYGPSKIGSHVDAPPLASRSSTLDLESIRFQVFTHSIPGLQDKGKDEGGHARGKSRCDEFSAVISWTIPMPCWGGWVSRHMGDHSTCFNEIRDGRANQTRRSRHIGDHSTCFSVIRYCSANQTRWSRHIGDHSTCFCWT